ncbi:hypothetical protein [Burkholderia sp. PAMC 26561]|uniref:Uncharacterized protein n=1 Tax=Caballeronia sordidicola TaxID=196367 RepID=A0A242MXV7_CABSO|nr:MULTISPECIES: hypothetical protein [Burkholderiaceae]AME27012.1 hypothetical protein AXG89_23955 [Burkholderia sp. PAMC 26561]AME27842.1 hypothetical protein AXG89_28735 [Burkholderia sp. PAMC 26561]OTP76152.1 hypothetical protein PAMC26577_11675 [Caballeronia sordidicola]
MVLAQANDPELSIADVAKEHGLNKNMVASGDANVRLRHRRRGRLRQNHFSISPAQITPSLTQHPTIKVER